MIPRIEILQEKKLIGSKLMMSFADYRISDLWRNFLSQKEKISNRVSDEMISIAIYQPNHFYDFNPTTKFEKWAAVEVSESENMSSELYPFTLPHGLYAVFDYKGLSTENSIFEYIFQTWLPASDYILDDRPHFEVLGEKYRNNDIDSEEEVWIPIKLR